MTENVHMKDISAHKSRTMVSELTKNVWDKERNIIRPANVYCEKF